MTTQNLPNTKIAIVGYGSQGRAHARTCAIGFDGRGLLRGPDTAKAEAMASG